MPQRLFVAYAVVVLTADLFALDGSDRFKIGDDPLHGALGDSHLQRHFAKNDERISRDEHQDVRVIRQKRPMRAGRSRRGPGGRAPFRMRRVGG